MIKKALQEFTRTVLDAIVEACFCEQVSAHLRLFAGGSKVECCALVAILHRAQVAVTKVRRASLEGFHISLLCCFQQCLQQERNLLQCHTSQYN